MMGNTLYDLDPLDLDVVGNTLCDLDPLDGPRSNDVFSW